MRIDDILTNFTENYDEEAMSMIDEFSESVKKTNREEKTMKLFSMEESAINFVKFMEGYVAYKIENVDNPESTGHDKVVNQTVNFIENQLFTSQDIKYVDLSGFIECYLGTISSLPEKCDNWQGVLIESGVDHNASAAVIEFVEKFCEMAYRNIEPSMDKILLASGYDNKLMIQGRSKPQRTSLIVETVDADLVEEAPPVFL